jgi:chromosome transmission fidelity protein 1
MQQLETYLAKFTSRLSGRNKMFIKHILALLRRLHTFLTQKQNSGGQVTANELLFDSSSGGLDQINFHNVEKYLRTSGLPRKVEGYLTHSKKDDNSTDPVHNPTTPALTILQSFLVALNNPRREGRIFYGPADNTMQFRYLLLDTSTVFSEIVNSARSVVLAGGTMSPLQSYIDALLPDIPQEKLRIHSFPHIVPKENLCVSTLSRGPSGREVTFDFSRRDDPGTVEELGRAILGLIGLVKKGGIVIFVPSYGYIDTLFNRWQNTILPKLQAKRKVSS